MRSHIYQQLAAESQRQSRFALGIISQVKGSSPQKTGAKALFFTDDRIIGTLGGGCLEAEVRLRARQCLRDGQPATFDLTLDHDYGWDDGLICGGRVAGLILPGAADAGEIWQPLARRDDTRAWGVRDDFSIAWADAEATAGWRYREVVSPPVALWIAGSGHIAQAVAKLAEDLDFDVTVFDDRAEFAQSGCFPSSAQLVVGPWSELLERRIPDPAARPTFGLVVTRGHKHDAKALEAWITQPFSFLGMIGSARKRRLIRDGFVKQNIATAEQFDRVACPAGLEIEAVSPAEIAVSIMAQFIQQRALLPAPAPTLAVL